MRALKRLLQFLRRPWRAWHHTEPAADRTAAIVPPLTGICPSVRARSLQEAFLLALLKDENKGVESG